MGIFDNGTVNAFVKFFLIFILIGFFKKDGKVKKGKHIEQNNVKATLIEANEKKTCF